MANSKERVLLYQFPADQAGADYGCTASDGGGRSDPSPDAWREKVGYLLGRKGF